jgi:hypothetical protein
MPKKSPKVIAKGGMIQITFPCDVVLQRRFRAACQRIDQSMNKIMPRLIQQFAEVVESRAKESVLQPEK